MQKEWGTENGKYPEPFDQPFHIVLNLAVGGQFVGEVAQETDFPAQMLVDWVKVYQR
jgi:beta-glucanase (GH16 family)